MRIPKKIHRVWIGGEMPPEFAAYEQQWRDLHPDWEVRTWREEDLGWLQNRAAFEDAPKLSSKSNIARYEIVLREGGLYVDTDYQPFRCFDELLEDVDLIVAREEPNFFANALFGAVAHSPILQAVVDGLPASHYSRAGAISPQRTGPHYFTRSVRRALVAQPDTRVQVLEREQVIPYSWRQPHLAGHTFPHAFAAHHWAKSWVAPTGSARPAKDRARRLAGGLAIRTKTLVRMAADRWERTEPIRRTRPGQAVALGTDRVLLVTSSGMPLVVGPEDADVISSIVTDGEHEPAFVAFLRRELLDGDIVAHVGPGAGPAPLYSAWRVGRMGRVYVVDTDERIVSVQGASTDLASRRGLQAEVLVMHAHIGPGQGSQRLDQLLRGNPEVGLVSVGTARGAGQVLASVDGLLADRTLRLLELRLDDIEAGAAWPELAERLRHIDRTFRPRSFTLGPGGERVPLSV